MANELNTINTYLLYKTGGSYTKLCEIKDYPDFFGDAEELETTDLSDTRRTYIAGIKTNDKLEFTANYNYTDFNTIKGLTAEQDLRIAFGSTAGANGYFDFKGYLGVRITGKGVNEVREMVISVIVSTDITAATA